MTAGEHATSTDAVPRRSARLVVRVGVAVLVLVVLAALVGLYGRWVKLDGFDSRPFRATDGGGTESDGVAQRFTTSGRDARLTWSLNEGVDRIQIAVVPAREIGKLRDWPAASITANDVGGVEFGTPDRTGTWTLAGLPPGEYMVRHWSRTKGSKTGHWFYLVEERLPWWRSPSSSRDRG